MTSSLQHQEVRIPAIPLPSHHLLWLFCCPPWLQFTFLPPSSRPIVGWCSSSCPPCILQGVEGGSLFPVWLPGKHSEEKKLA